MARTRQRRRFRSDRGGAIEGFPLYLLIIVIVTVVSIGIIFGMLRGVKPPTTIGDIVPTPGQLIVKDPDGDGTYNLTTTELHVIVTDSNGDRIKGAAVTLTGNSIKDKAGNPPFLATDADGTVSFTGLKMSIIGSTNPVTIEVQKSGLTSKTVTVPVIKQ